MANFEIKYIQGSVTYVAYLKADNFLKAIDTIKENNRTWGKTGNFKLIECIERIKTPFQI